MSRAPSERAGAHAEGAAALRSFTARTFALLAMNRPIVVIAVLGIALVGCDRKEAPPVQKAAEAIASAREDIEKAKVAIEATERRSKELEQKIAAQRAELTQLIERRATLLRQQLKDDEERIRRLPAQQETELRSKLAELGKQLEDAIAKLNAYRDAPSGKSAEALTALEKSLADYSAARRDLEARIQPRG
jgi:predicted RNase H-like nuclease (RuvC/YqgF family)